MSSTIARLIVEHAGSFLVILLPIAFNPFGARPFEPTKVALLHWTVLLLTFAYTWQLVTAPGRVRALWRQVRSPLGAAVMAYSTFAALAVARSVHRPASLSSAVSSASLLALFFIGASSIRSRHSVERLVSAALLGSIPVALYALVQYLGMDPLKWRTDSVSPVLSTMGRSNSLGAYLAVIVPLTLFQLSASKTPNARLRMWVILGLQTSGVLVTQARAAWLALVGGAVVFVAVAAEDKRRKWIVGVPALLACGVVVYLAINQIEIALADQKYAGSFVEARADTVTSRMTIWRNTSSLIYDRWLGGHGPGTYAGVFDSAYPVAFEGYRVDHPHNLMLALLFDSGFLGLTSFLMMVGVFFHELRATGGNDRYQVALKGALSGSVAGFLVQAQFNPESIVASTLFWLCLGIGASDAASNKRDTSFN